MGKKERKFTQTLEKKGEGKYDKNINTVRTKKNKILLTALHFYKCFQFLFLIDFCSLLISHFEIYFAKKWQNNLKSLDLFLKNFKILKN